MIMLSNIPVIKDFLQIKKLEKEIDKNITGTIQSLRNGGGEKLRRCCEEKRAEAK